MHQYERGSTVLLGFILVRSMDFDKGTVSRTSCYGIMQDTRTQNGFFAPKSLLFHLFT